MEQKMWLWITATVVAFFIKGVCGFANTLVFSSILAFGTTNANISPMELILGYPTNLIMTLKNRSQLNRKVYLPLTILVVLGSIPGAFVLKNTDPGYIKVVFGFVIVMLGIDMILRESKKLFFKESKIILWIIGVLSGVLCGLFGVGALLAAYVGRVTDNSTEFKANISAVFIVENTFRIVLYSIMGIITLQSIQQALMLMPFMLLGLFAGIKSSEIIPEKTVRKLVIILLLFSGLLMVIKNI